MKSKSHTLVLSGQDVIKITELIGVDQLMDLLIERLYTALANFNSNEVEVPMRDGFNYSKHLHGLIEWMPVHKIGDEVVIKVVGYHPENPSKFGLPTILSSISAYDTSTGHLKGIADGVLLTALRTGAASAVASKIMAAPWSRVLGLIGCGAQSITQLHALSRLFTFTKVLIYDCDPAVMNSFRNRIAALNLDMDIIFSSMEEIVMTSDIVCTATSIQAGTGPLFSGLSTNQHVHFNAVGSDFPGKFELPIGLLQKCVVSPDFLDQAKKEGECQQLESSEIGPDWVTLVQNPASFQDLKTRRTVFDSTGWALEDKVILDIYMEQAIQFNIGTRMAIENISQEAKNPYSFMRKTVYSSALGF